MTDQPTPPREPAPRGASALTRVLAAVGVVAIACAVVVSGFVAFKAISAEERTRHLLADESPFYQVPASVPGQPGSVIRSERLPFPITGGTGYRVVYTSIDNQGKPVAVSGMLFLPTKAAPAGGRKILAYAHGTVGLATQCAPSRAQEYSDGFNGWLEPALAQGWIVTATDYLGLGLQGGPPSFLVGEQEARDVVNSARAARAFQDSNAGRDWVVMGSSQGGHAALWTAERAKTLAPELRLRGVGAMAPAAELSSIVQHQWKTPVAWAIGPAAVASWSAHYPERDFQAPITTLGKDLTPTLMTTCVLEAGITGLIAEEFGGDYFSVDPLSDPSWRKTAEEQTPAPLPKTIPMFLGQGTADKVVLAGSNALLQQNWCRDGVTMQVDWLGGVSHEQAKDAGGPAFTEWAADRFAGKPAPRNCAFPPPAPTVAFAPVSGAS